METPKTSYRVMIDANVLISGMGWPRREYTILQHAIAGDFQLVLPTYVIEEVERYFETISPEAVVRFRSVLDLIEYEPIPDPSREEVVAHYGLVRDPKDVPIALAAIKAAVDCLVTRDKDFTESAELKKHIVVLLPAVFLRDYMGWTSEELEVIVKRNWNDVT